MPAWLVEVTTVALVATHAKVPVGDADASGRVGEDVHVVPLEPCATIIIDDVDVNPVDESNVLEPAATLGAVPFCCAAQMEPHPYVPFPALSK